MKITTSIAEAKNIIQEGRIVGFPTGTSYGLAADALQGHALQRLRNLKGRPKNKSFTVFLASSLHEEYLDLSTDERQLLSVAKQMPLTLLVKPKSSLEHLAQDGLIGLRVIDHPLMDTLAQDCRVPLTATSANKANETPCMSAEGVLEKFPSILDSRQPEIARAGETTYDLSLGCVLDGGVLAETLPSTIARLQGTTIEIIRVGTLSQATLQQMLQT